MCGGREEAEGGGGVEGGEEGEGGGGEGGWCVGSKAKDSKGGEWVWKKEMMNYLRCTIEGLTYLISGHI